MKSVLVPVLVAVALLSLQSESATAQWSYKTPGAPRLPDGTVNLSAPAPRTADGKPDLTGVWRSVGPSDGFNYNVSRDPKTGRFRLTPWAQEMYLKRTQNYGLESPLTKACQPNSIAFLMNFGGLFHLVQAPSAIVIMHEAPHSPHRTIFTDGRDLPKDPSPMWLGYSAGHWEQDTLVINSNGFSDEGWLDFGGTPQTESLRMIERMRRPDYGHLELEITFDDPKVFPQPLTIRKVKTLVPDTDILEDLCENTTLLSTVTPGVKVAADVLAKYAGTYEVAGRNIVVSVEGGQLMVEDPADLLHRLFIASTETVFQNNEGTTSIEFVKDSGGVVTHLIRQGAGDGKNEKGIKKGGAAPASNK